MIGIMLSTQPLWTAKTINGEKKTEVRSGTRLLTAINKLIATQGKAIIFMYCTTKESLFKTAEGRFYLKNEFACNEAKGFDYSGKVLACYEATAEEIKAHFVTKTLSYTTVNKTEYDTKTLSKGELQKKSCLSNNEMNKYFKYIYDKNVVGTAIHIKEVSLQRFSCPMELFEFKYGFGDNRRLTRAPQSWCYVEVEE